MGDRSTWVAVSYILVLIGNQTVYGAMFLVKPFCSKLKFYLQGLLKEGGQHVFLFKFSGGVSFLRCSTSSNEKLHEIISIFKAMPCKSV